jgi:hypothetical protein
LFQSGCKEYFEILAGLAAHRLILGLAVERFISGQQSVIAAFNCG